MPPIEHLIIGGGLAGVTIATHLWKQGRGFVLLEAAPRLGGKVETKWTNDGCFEFGPNSFTGKSEEIFTLLRYLGLETDLLIPTPEARHRFILKQGRIVRLPARPSEILTTRSLSAPGKIRFLSEFFSGGQGAGEESVWQFFARHFGSEVADCFADPFVSGIYAGDARRLSLPEAFPTMARAEQTSGSLLRYLIQQEKAGQTSPQAYQLKRGLESIFIRAREVLPPESIHLEEVVQEIAPEGDGVVVITKKGTYRTSHLYLTAPAYTAAAMTERALPELSTALRTIEYAPVITAHLKVSRQEKFPFAGFGILIPSMEQRKILGVLWNSSTFPALFRDTTHHYLTVYVGGARHPEFVQLGGDQLREMIVSELRRLFDLKQEPTLLHMRRHERAIPQYNLGYGKIRGALQTALKAYPHIKLAGNYLGGISMPDTVAAALQTLKTKTNLS